MYIHMYGLQCTVHHMQCNIFQGGDVKYRYMYMYMCMSVHMCILIIWKKGEQLGGKFVLVHVMVLT